MTDRQLQKQLESLQEVRAPKNVYRFVHTQTAALSDKHRGLYMPLIAFRLGMVAFVLFLCVVAASGVVIASQKSNAWTPLYPVKVLLQHIVPHTQIQQQHVKEAVAPTATPLPTQQTATPTPMTGEHHTITPSQREDDEVTAKAPVSNWIQELKHAIRNNFGHEDSSENHNGKDSSSKQQNKNK